MYGGAYITDGFRRKTFELLSRAYTSVPLPLVQSYLSLPAERVLEGKYTPALHDQLLLLTPSM